MKESVYIEDKETNYVSSVHIRKPIVLVLIVSVVFIVLLNLINAIVFY